MEEGERRDLGAVTLFSPAEYTANFTISNLLFYH